MNKFTIVGVVVACAAGGWAFMGPSAETSATNTSTVVSKSTGAQATTVTPTDNLSNPDANPKPPPTVLAELSAQNLEDAKRSAIVPGMWETNRDGRRVLTVLEDGTATMDVTVEGAFSFVVGSKMKFNINWQIVDGKLVFEMVDGKPESSVNAVISLYGKERSQEILEFTSKKFVLKDNDGEADHVWTRVKDQSAG